MRKWLKKLIKEAIDEQKLNTSKIIISSRFPESTDTNYEVGTIWLIDGKRFVLEKIEADWKEADDVTT